MRFAAVLFDFDGVVVDSELLACRTLAETLTAAGMACTADEARDLFMGHGWEANQATIRARWGRDLPPDLAATRADRFRDRLDEVQPVPGVVDFLAVLGLTPRAVGSASRPQWLAFMLERLGLAAAFGPHVYSAAHHVARSKPFPDIYEYAAAQLGVAPADCLVIEDSVPGATAGLASGAATVALLAGSHMADPAFRVAHAERLRAAGVERVFDSYAALAEWAGA